MTPIYRGLKPDTSGFSYRIGDRNFGVIGRQFLAIWEKITRTKKPDWIKA